MGSPLGDSTVRVALVGCGRVAQRVHAPLLATMPGSSLVAVVDPSADAKVVASQLNPRVDLYESLDELLDAGGFDAVCICLPTHMHAACAKKVLGAGYPVYLEKPIAATEGDAAALLDKWVESGCIAMVGFNYRFHPLHQKLKTMLDSDAVGRITAIRTIFTTPPRVLPQWKRSHAGGGGVLLDLLSHHADLAAFHTGQQPESVSAIVRSVYSDNDNAQVSWTLRNGITVQSTVSMSGAEQDRFEVVGEDGAIVVDRFRNSLIRIPRSHSATTPELCARGFGLAVNSLRALRPSQDPSFRAALSCFVEGVRTGAQSIPDLRDGWNSLSLVLAALDSASNDSILTDVCEEPALDANESYKPPIEFDNLKADLPKQKLDDPLLSVALVTITGVSSLRKVLSCLRRQTIAHQIQLLIVAPDEDTLRDLSEADQSGFHNVSKVCVGPIDDVDKAAAHATQNASSHYLCFLEDHAFPAEDWAEQILSAFEIGHWDAVGTAIENGNPASTLSWANMLMSYGEWVAAEHSGPTANVARHNTTFRCETLRREYGDSLPQMMGRDGGLLADLLARGCVFYMQPKASAEHLNPSTWRSTLQLRIGSGRLFASSRMKRERWSAPKRFLYILCGFTIPFIRFKLLRAKLMSSSARRTRIGLRAYPALIVGVTLDGVGQFLGHTIGPGKVKQKLAFFEISRIRHLNRRDKHLMSETDS
jgi:predicted dehydrogenase